MNNDQYRMAFDEGDRFIHISQCLFNRAKAFFQLQYLLRIRTKLYIFYYLIGIIFLFTYLSLSFDQSTNSFQSKQIHPNYSLSLNSTRILFHSNSSELFISSNHREVAQNLTSSFFESSNSIFMSNGSEILDKINNYNGNATVLFGFDIHCNLSTPEYSITTITSTMYPKYTSETFINAFSQYFLKKSYPNITFSFDTKPYKSASQSVNISKASAGVIYFMIGHLMIHTGSVYIYSQLNQQKLLFLLEINGITNTIRFWFTYVLLIIEHLPINIIAAQLFCFQCDLSKGTNFSLFLFSEYMFTIVVFSIQIFFQPLLHSTGLASFYSGAMIFVFIMFEFTIILENYFSPEEYKLLLSLFGPSSFIKMCDFMIRKKNDNSQLNWSNLDYSVNNISARFVLFAQIFNALFCLFISWLGHICNNNCYGKPPVGWRHFFNLKTWKKFFRKSRRLIIDQDSDEPITEININTPSIELENITKEYVGVQTKTVALDNVSLNIAQGEFIVAIGPNGSGKSSLISSIIGEISLNSGIIKLYGNQLHNDFDELMYPILGIAFQENVLFDQLTTKEHFELFGRLCNYSDYTIFEKMEYFMDILKMKEYENSLAGNLSGGTKRKLCISLALLKNPPIIILDEPTSGVDAQSRQLIWALVSTFRNSTVFFTTHSVQESESASSRLLVMSKSKIVFIGTPSELRERYLCCYYLSIVNDGYVDMKHVVDCLNQSVQMEGEIRLHPDDPFTLLIPNNLHVADVLKYIETHKQILGIEKYVIRLENLEETMKKILENDEATMNHRY